MSLALLRYIHQYNMDHPPSPIPPKPATPSNLRLTEGRESGEEIPPHLRAPSPNSPVALAVLFTAGFCFLAAMLALAFTQEIRERKEAQESAQRAMSYQAVYLDQANNAEVRATKARTRAEYLEELLRQHLKPEAILPEKNDAQTYKSVSPPPINSEFPFLK